MDVAPRVDRLLAKAVDEQVNEQRSLREALEALAGRIGGLEGTTAALEEKFRSWSDPAAAPADLAFRVEERFAERLDALEGRLDELALAIEDRAVETLNVELQATTDDLRKAMGELGRMLVRDRSRISHALTEHRNAILAELRLPGGGARLPRFEDGEEDDDEVAPVGPSRRLRRVRFQ